MKNMLRTPRNSTESGKRFSYNTIASMGVWEPKKGDMIVAFLFSLAKDIFYSTL
jgi:hypothetical protein